MSILNRIVVLTLGDQRYGLPLSAVERVVRVVDVTPLPRAPDIVLGVVNVQGRVIPVVNLRRRFRLPERDLALTDQLVIARTARRPVALAAWANPPVDHDIHYSVVANLDDTFRASALCDGGGVVSHKLPTSE